MLKRSPGDFLTQRYDFSIIKINSLLTNLFCLITQGSDSSTQVQEKLFTPEILCIYIDLVHFAMEALDIYTVNVNPTQQRTSGLISRSKEEKEVLEHFSGIVSIMFNRNFTISLSLKTINILCFFY